MTDPIVTAEYLKDHFNDPELIILDASEKDNKSNLKSAYPNLAIQSARFFDSQNTFKDRKNSIPNMIPTSEVFDEGCRKLGINKNSKIVIYDNLGVYNSPRAWWMFKVMGHADVSVLDGGLPEWIRLGYKTQSISKQKFSLGNFKSNYQPHLIKNHHQILENLSTREFRLIDARSNGRFHANSPEPRVDLKGGHIPNSLNLPFSEVVKNGKYLSKSRLEEIVRELNLGDETLVFTCGSGITACIILLAIEQVKSNPKALYDGSWSEWGQLDGVPINQ